MESLRALGFGSIGIPELKKAIYYTVILFACLSIFRRTRWWILFIIRAIWLLGFEFWINYFLVYNANGNDAMLRRLLTGTQLQREPLGKGEPWYRIWGRKTRKQRIRERHKDIVDRQPEEGIWHGLVDPEGKPFPRDRSCPANRLNKRRSRGLVESVAQPMKQYGAVGAHDDGTVRGGSSQSSVKGGDTADEGQSCQSGQNGSLGRKTKEKSKKRR